MMRPGSHFQEFGVGDGRKQAGLVGIYTLSRGNLAFPVFTFELGFG